MPSLRGREPTRNESIGTNGNYLKRYGLNGYYTEIHVVSVSGARAGVGILLLITGSDFPEACGPCGPWASS